MNEEGKNQEPEAFPEQVEAVYKILTSLAEEDVIADFPRDFKGDYVSDDRLTRELVVMTRDMRPSVAPLRDPETSKAKKKWVVGNIDISSIVSAKIQLGTWWFLGPIEALQVKIKRTPDNKLQLEEWAKEGKFKLQLLK